MCGIAVICNTSGAPVDRPMLERMTGSLAHRGPDDAGDFVDGAVGFGFRRLAILDLSQAGHQPMVSEDGRYVLVYNGEIYNFIELRNELTGLGYRFTSTSDTEVVLNAYRQWGSDCLSRFNGMWAFILYDRTARRLFGSRDRFGVKPLFIYRGKEQVLFASEIKAIRASGGYRGGVNWKVASRFLIEGHLDDGPESFYEGISSIQPGSAFELSASGEWKSWTYWRFDQASVVGGQNIPERYAGLFEDAVRLRMRSDVPVGVCLSGGLDSSAIICAAARQRAEGKLWAAGALQAFCYSAKEFDESRYIRDTVGLSKAQLWEVQTSPREIWDDLRQMLWFQDEPVHTLTAVVGYQLMRLVAAHDIRVVLNGQGADEVIGGYSSYFGDYWRELLREGRVSEAIGEIRAYNEVHGGGLIDRLHDAALSCMAASVQGNRFYRVLSDGRYEKRVRQHPWFASDLTSRFPSEARIRKAHGLNEVLEQSVRVAPLPLYLRIEDRNSMAHSVEARLPFLDYRLVLFSFGLAPEWKLRGPWNKYVLREAMRNRIPESVRTRADKMGFPTPGKQWFAQDLYEPMADLLSSNAVRERGIYNVKTVREDLERHRRGEIDAYQDLFHLAEFELMAEFLKEEPSPTALEIGGRHLKRPDLVAQPPSPGH